MTYGDRFPQGSADPGSREATPAAAVPPPVPPAPPPALADPVGAGQGDRPVPPSVQRPSAPDSGAGHAAVSGAAVEDGASTLLDRDEHDRLAARLHQAVSGFVDEPRRAVEQADDVFDEAARHLEHALAERRRALRERWQNGHAPRAAEPSGAAAGPAAPLSGAETEGLRLALQHYREATERLLQL